MITPELIQYIIKERGRGVDDAAIRESLINGGWQAADVDEGFESINKTAAAQASAPSSENMITPQTHMMPPQEKNPVMQTKTPKKKTGLKVGLVALFIIIVVIVGGGFAYANGLFSLPFSVPFLNPEPEAVVEQAFAAMQTADSAEFEGTMLIEVDSQSGGFGLPLSEALVTISGGVTNANSEDVRLAYTTGIEFGDIKAEVELRMVDEKIYIHANRLPRLPVFDLSSFEGQWIEIASPEELSEEFGVDLTDFTDQVSKSIENQQAIQQEAMRLAQEYPIFSVSENYGLARVEGRPVYHYGLTLDMENVMVVLNELQAAFPDDLQGQLPSVEEFAQVTDALQNTTFEIWINRGNHHINQIRFTADISEESIGAQGSFIFEMRFKNIGKSLTIEAPTDAVPVMEFIEQVFNSGPLGAARAQAVDAQISAVLSQIRAQAELDASSGPGAFTGLCSGSMGNSIELIQSAEEAGGTVTCLDSADKYFVHAVLPSGDEFCVDSTGFAGEAMYDEVAIACVR